MKVPNLASLSVDQLVDRFADIAVAQDRALLEDDRQKFKRLFWQMDEVDQEIRGRGTDSRLRLLRLYDHPNLQVRLKAAKHTLAVAPVAARAVLEAVRGGKDPAASA